MIWRSRIPPDTTTAVVDAMRRREVLVVDDVRAVAESIARLVQCVRGDDLHVTIATRAAEATEHVERRRFDLIVADYRLDAGNGLDVLRLARRLQPEARRVLVTGYDDIPATPAEFDDAALAAAFAKPLDPQAFVLAVGFMLREAPPLGASGFAAPKGPRGPLAVAEDHAPLHGAADE